MDAIQRQIIWDRMLAVVEEQAQTLIRTGFSTPTREAGDVSAGIFDIQGRMLAQAVTGTPGHVNSMAKAVRHFLAAHPPETLRDGDVLLTNDPWLGTGHLHDFTFVTPMLRGGWPVAFFASTTHVVDVGGRGLSADGRQVFEEGLRIPIMHFAAEGVVNEALLAIVRSNVREPVQVVGDLYALMACNETGARRLAEVLDEYGLADIDAVAAHILETSREATLKAVRALPAGVYRSAMTIDGYDTPIDLVASLTIDADGISVDLAGSSPASPFAINVPLCYTEAYATFGIRCVVAPDIPNNDGSLSVVKVTAPAGCIVAAVDPAPVSVRHVIGQMLPDLMFGALVQIAPDKVPAEGTSCLWNLSAMGGVGRVDTAPDALVNAVPFNVISFHSGGTGARPGLDGLSATAFPSGVRNMAVEITEALSPLVIWRKELRQDSGGAGQYRGGLGQVMEVASTDDAPFAISAYYDRIGFPPRGRNGGADGAAGRLTLSTGVTLNGKGQQTVPAGAHLLIEMPGGGGIGDPALREPADLMLDVKEGYVSQAAAARLYRPAT